MTDRITLAVLGGDVRQIAMAGVLANQGYRVLVWGLGECDAGVGAATPCESWQNAVEAAHAVILPLPASADGVRVHAPLHNAEHSLRVSTLLEKMSGRLLLGGRISESAQYTWEYVLYSTIEKLYTFNVKEEVLTEFARCVEENKRRFVDKQFHSLDILEILLENIS